MADLIRYRATVENAGTDQASVTVTSPHGESWPVQNEDLRRKLEDRLGAPLFLLRDYRGSFDVAHVSLISRQTSARIAEESGTPENVLRFRPNLVVDLDSGRPFEELDWVGKTVQVGEQARIAFTEVDQRCMMITLDPDTAVATPAVLKYVVQQHDKCAGIYGSVLTAGEIRVGDAVRVE